MNALHPTPSAHPNLTQIGVTVLERGWLSSNNILFQGPRSTALVDSGYATHADQTLLLVQENLLGKPLDLLLNTHLHSDHCGGNAALQAHFPDLITLIPPGQAAFVTNWDPVALIFEPVGQVCPRFTFQGLLEPGTSIELGDRDWEIHAARGHDPHSIVLFEPASRVMLTADALWENGFGIVFPELEGIQAFDDVARTLDLIEALNPATIIPGHGQVFGDLTGSLVRARRRLDQFVQDPQKHRRHALKVLIKFKLLEWQSVSMAELFDWYAHTPYFAMIEQRPDATQTDHGRASLQGLIHDLAKSNALRIEQDQLVNI
jgi:glyoxylase-like metal-dependent hydrolase (beta-lactamase superfamily II)